MTSAIGNDARRERLFQVRSARGAGHGYSRLVRSLRLLLPLLAAGLLVLAMIWPQLDWRSVVLSDDVDTTIDINDAQQLRMRNAKLVGVDEDNQPFKISAAEARQGEDGINSVILDRPAGEIAMKDGTELTMQADNGLYNRNEDRLELSGSVTVTHGDGYRLQTESATVLMKSGRASGNQLIDGYGPEGLIQGEGFEIVDKGKTVRILGKSRLVFSPPPEQR
jgi:lipopolysaccharide export system protein LptC